MRGLTVDDAAAVAALSAYRAGFTAWLPAAGSWLHELAALPRAVEYDLLDPRLAFGPSRRRIEHRYYGLC